MDPRKLRVPELKEELLKRGLDVNGVKQDLIQRLQVALDEEEFGIPNDLPITTNIGNILNESKTIELENTETFDEQNETFDLVDDGDDQDVEIKGDNKQKVTPQITQSSISSTPLTTTTSSTTTSNLSSSTSNTSKVTKVEESKVQTPQNTSTTSSSTTTTTTTISKSNNNNSNNVEKKQKTEEEKRADRAAKFNLPTKNDAEVAKGKLAARAERFGTTKPASLEEKKQARAKRFGSDNVTVSSSVKNPTSDNQADIDKIKARAMRFQLGSSGNTDTILTEMQEKKKRRLERFGGN